MTSATTTTTTIINKGFSRLISRSTLFSVFLFFVVYSYTRLYKLSLVETAKNPQFWEAFALSVYNITNSIKVQRLNTKNDHSSNGISIQRDIPMVFATPVQPNIRNESSTTNQEQADKTDKLASDQMEIALGITKYEQQYHRIKHIPHITMPIKPGGKCFFESSSNKAAAIIVPIRGRIEHLRVFISYMHGFLQQQNISYGIYVVEQKDNQSFNRGFLLNVGVQSALLDYPYTCVYLHDVDLLPENKDVSYVCPEVTTHMCTAHMEFKYGIPYATYFGGVTAATTKQYIWANGMSNLYWGWGGEDDDFRKRLISHRLKFTSKPKTQGRYLHLKHKKNTDLAKNRYQLLQKTTKTAKKDGLQHMPSYLQQMNRYKYYTLISAYLKLK